jgi:hypothetical protein
VARRRFTRAITFDQPSSAISPPARAMVAGWVATSLDRHPALTLSVAARPIGGVDAWIGVANAEMNRHDLDAAAEAPRRTLPNFQSLAPAIRSPPNAVGSR